MVFNMRPTASTCIHTCPQCPQAISTKDKEYLQMCDQVRDEMLPDVGIQLEDKKDGRLPLDPLVDFELAMPLPVSLRAAIVWVLIQLPSLGRNPVELPLP